MKLLAIDPDPWAKLLPTIAHDLELQANGLQLLRRRVTYFYGEFFHIFILSFFCVCFMALEAWSLRLISFRNFLQLFTYEGGRSSSAIVKYLNSDRRELSLINLTAPYIL